MMDNIVILDELYKKRVKVNIDPDKIFMEILKYIRKGDMVLFDINSINTMNFRNDIRYPLKILSTNPLKTTNDLADQIKKIVEYVSIAEIYPSVYKIDIYYRLISIYVYGMTSDQYKNIEYDEKDYMKVKKIKVIKPIYGLMDIYRTTTNLLKYDEWMSTDNWYFSILKEQKFFRNYDIKTDMKKIKNINSNKTKVKSNFPKKINDLIRNKVLNGTNYNIVTGTYVYNIFMRETNANKVIPMKNLEILSTSPMTVINDLKKLLEKDGLKIKIVADTNQMMYMWIKRYRVYLNRGNNIENGGNNNRNNNNGNNKGGGNSGVNNKENNLLMDIYEVIEPYISNRYFDRNNGIKLYISNFHQIILFFLIKLMHTSNKKLKLQYKKMIYNLYMERDNKLNKEGLSGLETGVYQVFQANYINYSLKRKYVIKDGYKRELI